MDRTGLLTVFPPPGETLTARCIRPNHWDAQPSMVIYDNGVYCFGCGSSWQPDQFLAELGQRPLLITSTHTTHKSHKPRFIPMAMVETYNKWLNTHYAARLEWLYARGLRLEDSINLNKLGYDGSAFVIPVLEDRFVQALRFRRDEIWEDELEGESGPKYWGLPGRNAVTLYKPKIPNYIPLKSDTVHLCEGELDALRLAQEGLIAWSLTNGCRSFRPEHVEAFEGQKVLIVYDQDDVGRQASRRIAKLLGCRQAMWPEVLGKDVTEFLQRWSLSAFMNHL